MLPKLVLVGSPSRSGSTLLDLMLGTRPDALSLGEIYAHFRPWREHHFDSPCGCGQRPCPVRSKMLTTGERTFHAHLFERLHKKLVIDSSKDLNWIIDSIRWARGYSVQVVLIYKDPVSLSHSHYKRGGDIMRWRSHYQYYFDFLQLDVPFVSIRFNGLVGDPATSVERLCRALRIEHLPGQERFWTGDHHHFFGSGVRKMLRSDEPRIERREVFSAEFEERIPQIEAAVEGDPDLQRVLARLAARDVLLQDPETLTLPPTPSVSPPAWYYKRKLRQWYNRLFPTRFRPSGRRQ